MKRTKQTISIPTLAFFCYLSMGCGSTWNGVKSDVHRWTQPRQQFEPLGTTEPEPRVRTTTMHSPW